jgi:peptidoglycan/LPS O-acetylase OafA/YrhL
MFHFRQQNLPGGFIGVDVFFVLSGFLITTLLVVEHAHTGRIDLRAFYVRRVARLFPAMAALIVGVLVLDMFIPNPVDGTNQRLDAIAVLAYIGNGFFALEHDGLGYLSHTWSLAIEEQFYLAWPLALIVLMAKGRRTALIVLGVAVAAIVVARVGVYAIDHRFAIDYGYANTFSRADSLLVGCLLALCAGRLGALLSTPIAFLAAAALGAVALTTTILTPAMMLGGYTAIALAAAIIIGNVHAYPGGPLARVLALRPLASVGLISYGLYLYHYPVLIALGSTDLRSSHRAVIGLAMTFLIASISYFVIERPARRAIRARWGRERATPHGGGGAPRPAGNPL